MCGAGGRFTGLREERGDDVVLVSFLGGCVEGMTLDGIILGDFPTSFFSGGAAFIQKGISWFGVYWACCNIARDSSKFSPFLPPHYPAGLAPAGTLRAPSGVRLSPHSILQGRPKIGASSHFRPSLPSAARLNARACFQSISRILLLSPAKTHASPPRLIFRFV